MNQELTLEGGHWETAWRKHPGFWDYLCIYCSLFFFFIVLFISMNITIYRLTFTLRYAELPPNTQNTWLLEFGKNLSYRRPGIQDLFSSYGFSLENYRSPRASVTTTLTVRHSKRKKKPPLCCRTHEWLEWSVSSLIQTEFCCWWSEV